MTISPDSQAILLLCSHIGLLSNSEYSSLTLKEWNPLAKRLQSFSMRPGDLIGVAPKEIQVDWELTWKKRNVIITYSNEVDL